LLNEHDAAFTYREYDKEPLTKQELKEVFSKLKMKPAELLRKNDKAYKDLGLTGAESDAKLIGYMAEHPTLLQRPIAVKGNKAVVGRPVENLLNLL
jgi:arsenate reductase